MLHREDAGTITQEKWKRKGDALELAFGGWKDFDHKAFIAEMKLQRGQGEEEESGSTSDQ